MKIVMKFKDGMAVTNDLGEDFRTEGNGDLFALILKGKANNADININGENGISMVKKYEDLYSFEIIL